MTELTQNHERILKRYSRPIVHLRQQVKSNRFGLVIGAGLSKSFGVPTWDKLITILSEDPDIQGQDVLQKVSSQAGLPYKTEVLFEHYKKIQYDQSDPKEHRTRELDYRIGSDWKEVIRKHLYLNVEGDIEDTIAQHKYLSIYLPLILRSHMTVTYNFDDFIEQALLNLLKKDEQDPRGFETVTNPWPQFRRTEGIIYHPNGVIPQNALKTPSDRFVFSEASYAEQLVGIYAGDQAWMVHHLSKYTCLFIGLSLNDDILRSVLMQSAKSCPGSFHYYVYHLKGKEVLSAQQKHAIRLANFKVYNLITLFLRSDEIHTFGEMIDNKIHNSNSLCDFAKLRDIKMHFPFYLTGALGIGKSTTINQFRNLYVYDEWVEERPQLLAKYWEELSNEEKEEADEYVIRQFMIKNDKLRNIREGIFLMDRGPLDPLAFTPKNAWKDKALKILDTLCLNRKWDVEKGKVLLLQGDSHELELRMILTQRKHYTAEKLERMENRLGTAYGTVGVVRIDTRGLSPSEVTRCVAEIVHLGPEEPVCTLHDRLEGIKEEKINAPD